ncbi:ABC transporter ATP-binding protein [Halothiobacillus neapolitanus]|uniref:ABC transporter ATP-binding protein n=1 Tax=Halothiobacillus neapolitanus TaxID=927 RepID=UPI00019802F5|nr:ATP-binding cassette domain-containing protein [Halothiobacillus neapolitanus]TDN60367.1 putative ABC transport system ATP-binding protein [Halothiobacillus neapolitanus]
MPPEPQTVFHAASLPEDTALILRALRVSKTVTAPGNEPLTILRDASLTVAEGEAVALMGASGAGKSTLLALLAGLDTPTSGEVELAGFSLNNLNEDERAAVRAGRVGFVFQSFQLIDGLTALENVALPLELQGTANSTAQAKAALDEVGLSHRLHHLPKVLSGGEQQRVALARAFAGTPAILFADEPTGSLDTATGERIIDLLFALRDQHQTALVLVTHDPALAARCNRGYRLQGGLQGGELTPWQ